jgi:hypothetical protein
MADWFLSYLETFMVHFMLTTYIVTESEDQVRRGLLTLSTGWRGLFDKTHTKSNSITLTPFFFVKRNNTSAWICSEAWAVVLMQQGRLSNASYSEQLSANSFRRTADDDHQQENTMDTTDARTLICWFGCSMERRH